MITRLGLRSVLLVKNINGNLNMVHNCIDNCKFEWIEMKLNPVYNRIYLFLSIFLLRIDSNQLLAFWGNIPITKSKSLNILGASGIWKHWKVNDAIRCSTLNGLSITFSKIWDYTDSQLVRFAHLPLINN